MRIYHVKVEHVQLGGNFDAFNIAAKDFTAAVVAATSRLEKGEKIEEVVLLASTDLHESR